MYYEGALGFGPPRPAAGVGGPGAFLTVAGSFLLATCNAEFIGGGGMANRYQNCAVLCWLSISKRATVSRWESHIQSARGSILRCDYNRGGFQPPAYLAGWAFAFSVVLMTLMLIAHGVHF
jgi:hypothetical protein